MHIVYFDWITPSYFLILSTPISSSHPVTQPCLNFSHCSPGPLPTMLISFLINPTHLPMQFLLYQQNSNSEKQIHSHGSLLFFLTYTITPRQYAHTSAFWIWLHPASLWLSIPPASPQHCALPSAHMQFPLTGMSSSLYPTGELRLIVGGSVLGRLQGTPYAQAPLQQQGTFALPHLHWAELPQGPHLTGLCVPSIKTQGPGPVAGRWYVLAHRCSTRDLIND
jgi:hypothetical protein